ncbi:MAG: hypothetical protein UR93_C0016G0009, partial [Berkelbacteria bacterium GW2011_GWA2_35_9]
MKIEIDQSGKIEQTSHTTAIGLSNDIQIAVTITGREKQKLLVHFRKINQRKVFMIVTFCVLIYITLKEVNTDKYEIYIDREYNGYDKFVKSKIVDLFKENSNKSINIHKLHIVSVGRDSNAHKVANFSAKNK